MNVITVLGRHRHLVNQLVRRDIAARYRGSALGLAWSVLQPVLLLAIYTFVFTQIFKARWPGAGGTEGETAFALILFIGMIVHGFFAECLNRAPALIVGNANYVKKVVFPLEVLPVVALGTALFHTAICIGVFLFFALLTGVPLGLPALTLPLVLLPLLLVTLGCMWLVAALGVYLRDISYIVTFITSLLLFLSPVFYPLSVVPERFRPLLAVNPLTHFIEQSRAVTLHAAWPDWLALGAWLAGSVLFAWLCLRWFERARKGFADVL